MARFYIENFGCRATQADGAALDRQFLERGLDRAQAIAEAEIVVLNTCTVTEGADKDVRASIRRLQRENPACQILVTGCYAQRAPDELAALPGVTWVVGNSHKHQAVDIATSSLPKQGLSGDSNFVPLTQLCENRPGTVVVGDIFAHTELLAAPVFEASNERTRPNLKVQDGCDNRCSFCVIPYVRGQSRSLPLDKVVAEVELLVAAGYREVVLSGINLGRWGRDLNSHRAAEVSPQLSGFGRQSLVHRNAEHLSFTTDTMPRKSPRERRTTNDQRLVGLIRTILDYTSLEKLRISSVEPMDWSDELIALVAGSPRIAKHAHVPMQSGSDAVLRRMHRKYRPWHYREKIAKIRAAMPTAAIGADVMVGFPDETEVEFGETQRMIEELPFTYLHVFTYSPRPGTPAAKHPKQVPAEVSRQRNRRLREIASEKKLRFMQSLVGTSAEVITLQAGGDDFTEALTDNYLKMKVAGRYEPNNWMCVDVIRVDGEIMVGQVGGRHAADDSKVHRLQQTH